MYDEFSVRGEEMVDVFDQTPDLLLSQLIFLSDVMQSVSLLFHHHVVRPKICCLREEFALHLGLHQEGLERILLYHDEHPDKVVLLLGNHDLHYLVQVGS